MWCPRLQVAPCDIRTPGPLWTPSSPTCSQHFCCCPLSCSWVDIEPGWLPLRSAGSGQNPQVDVDALWRELLKLTAREKAWGSKRSATGEWCLFLRRRDEVEPSQDNWGRQNPQQKSVAQEDEHRWPQGHPWGRWYGSEQVGGRRGMCACHVSYLPDKNNPPKWGFAKHMLCVELVTFPAFMLLEPNMFIYIF